MPRNGRVAILSILVVGSVAPGAYGTAVSAQDASGAPAVAAFSATLKAVQTQHIASALNLKYDFPNEYCKNGLETYSMDQSMTFEGDPVAVEVATTDQPPDGWGTQDAFLYPQGGSAQDVIGQPPSDYLMLALPQFELSGTIDVIRSAARPAVGDQPDAVPYDTVCAGGGDAVSTPQPSDCGERTIETTMGVIPKAPGQVFAWATEVDPSAEDIYTNCFPRPDMALGQFVGYDDGVTVVTIDGGELPTRAELLDPSVPKLDVTGSADGLYDADGSLTATHDEWSLTLCRIAAGTPAC
jgi:hypothetical protein